jgi:outer membrane lipase/esterase
MRMKQACFAIAVLLSLTQLAQAQNFNQLIGFGDSATDTGWFTGATSGPHSTGFAPFDLSIAAALADGGNGHWTGPGLGNAQILAAHFGLSANAVGTPGGTNYAIGNDVDFLVPPGFVPPTATGNLFPNGLLPGTATQISNYLASVNGHANPNALYLLSSGGNDITAALQVFGPFSPAGVAYLLGEAQTLANSLASLQAAGARYIIMSNYYPGPVNVPAGTFYGETILSATWNDLAAAGVRFIPADTISVFRAVEQDPAAFGITHDPHIVGPPGYACLPPTGSGLTSGYGILCAPTTTPSATHGYMQSADATQTYLFMDGVHLTERGQQIEADYFYNLLVAPSEVSFLAETAVQTTFQTITGIQQQIDLAQQRLRPSGWNVWINGQLSYLKMNNSSAGFPDDPGLPLSGTMGVDYKWQNGWLAGAAVTVGYVNPTFSLGGGYKQDSAALSLYAGYRNANWWGDLIGTAAWLGFDTNRTIPIGITVQPNNGSTSGDDLSLAGEIGYDFHSGAVTHGPVAGFILQQARVGGFTESGSFTSLSFGTQIRNSEVSVLGYKAGFDWGMWHPYAQVVWDHEFDPLNRMVTASLTTIAAPSYSLPAVVLGRDWATATVGTQVTFTPAWSGFASLTAQLGQNHATIFGGLLGLNYALGQTRGPIVYKN